MKSLKYYISPFFLSKHYLYNDIRSYVHQYKFKGEIFDFGCGSKPYKELFNVADKYTGIDFPSFSENKGYQVNSPDLFFGNDYTKTLSLDFDDNHFDNSVSFQVLEHHQNPKKMVSELVRVTKPGGYILLTFPFMGGIHEEPHDYQRLTKYGFQEIIRELPVEIISLKKQGSIFSTLLMLLSEYLNDIASHGKAKYYLIALIFIPVLFSQYISIFIDMVLKSDKIFFNYLVLIKKR